MKLIRIHINNHYPDDHYSPVILRIYVFRGFERRSTAQQDWRNGRAYGYPRCCISWFLVRAWIAGRTNIFIDFLVFGNHEGMVKCPYHSIKHRHLNVDPVTEIPAGVVRPQAFSS